MTLKDMADVLGLTILGTTAARSAVVTAEEAEALVRESQRKTNLLINVIQKLNEEERANHEGSAGQ